MEQLIGIIVAVAIVLFAINKMAPTDSAAKKFAMYIIAAGAAALGTVIDWVQGLL